METNEIQSVTFTKSPHYRTHLISDALASEVTDDLILLDLFLTRQPLIY